MLPVIALVGRPNVGKSTLFNVLTRTRDALVADMPGLTRDRQYGIGRVGERPYVVVDTGGLGMDDAGIDGLMARQAKVAIGEAQVVLFLVDGRAGLTGADERIAAELRRTGKSIYLVVNKSEGQQSDSAVAEFHTLGLGEPFAISATHGGGIARLMDSVLAQLPAMAIAEESAPPEGEEESVRIALIGRPNVGKSTLTNRLLGEERVLTFDQPGTTRDSIAIPFERDGVHYTLIDTAGVRRRGRIDEAIEKFSVIKSLQAMEAAHVVILVLDASEGVSDQDASLLGHVLRSGRAVVVAINKWDGLSVDQRDNVRRDLDLKFPFLDFAEQHFISALHGSGVGLLLESVMRAYRSARVKMATPELTRILERAVQAHQPPLVHGRRIKLRYAHQGGSNPPIVVIHGNQTERVPDAYTRYLEKTFRTAFRLTGTPVRVQYKAGTNPYEGRKNPLTPRQIQKRKRLMRHIKKRG